MPRHHFVHLQTFDRSAAGLLDDEDIRLLQLTLDENPHAGALVQRTGGIRKIRISSSGKGKRGGSRVLYLYVKARARIYLIAAYAKSDQADITPAGYRMLARLTDTLKGEE